MRAVAALAVLRQRVEMIHSTFRLDALGRNEFSGFNALLSIDFVLFPEWATTFRVNGGPGPPDTWLATARGIHRDATTPGWTMALDLVTWFIAGHEAFHAQGTCALTRPSFPETSGYADDVTWLQQEEFFCPNPPENVEVNADACGLRWLEAADAAGASSTLDSETRKVARATAMLTLSALFYQGLRGPMEGTSRYEPTGYLYPHFRIALVHRTLFRLNEGDVRLGLCGDVLSGMWVDADQRTYCVTSSSEVTLVPQRITLPAFTALPSVEITRPSSPMMRGQFSCLDGTARLPTLRTSVRRDASVRVNVLAVEQQGDEESRSNALTSVRAQLRRPGLHAALSACLSQSEVERQFRLHYSNAGALTAVSGTARESDRFCVRNVLAPFKFGGYASGVPERDAEPAYVLVLQLRRKP
jgi:hypothetical protein